MPQIRLFAQARQVAGVGRDQLEGDTVAAVLQTAARRYGDEFESLLPHCTVWLNGDTSPLTAPVGAGDEVAVLPPVSGGAR